MTESSRRGRLMPRLVLGLVLVAILFSAGQYLMDHPSLVVHGQGNQASPSVPSDAPMNPDGALMALMQRLQADPGNPETLLMMARHFLHSGDPARGEHFALLAGKAAPEDSEPPYLLGVARHQQGRNAEAAAALEDALKLRNDAETHYSLGVLYTHFLNQPEKGRRELAAALEAPGLTGELKDRIERELAVGR